MSVSTTSLIRKMCAAYALPLFETPIGFKHICKELKAQDAMMGGEESGGISFRDHVHERDGVFNGLLLLEMMALHGKTLGELIKDLYAEFGEFNFVRRDHHVSQEKIARAKEIATNNNIAEVGGVSVDNINRMDGTKVFFKDGSWLLMRASGTEPLMRTYAEASSMARVNELLDFAQSHLGF